MLLCIYNKVNHHYKQVLCHVITSENICCYPIYLLVSDAVDLFWLIMHQSV